jgi:hypothetical protein
VAWCPGRSWDGTSALSVRTKHHAQHGPGLSHAGKGREYAPARVIGWLCKRDHAGRSPGREGTGRWDAAVTRSGNRPEGKPGERVRFPVRVVAWHGARGDPGTGFAIEPMKHHAQAQRGLGHHSRETGREIADRAGRRGCAKAPARAALEWPGRCGPGRTTGQACGWGGGSTG